jgi:PAS domain S-box-containing protein
MTIPVEKTSILIVDNLPENLSALQKILEELHVDIVTVGTGREALHTILNQTFSLVLLNLHLPDMAVADVVETLRQQTATANIPIIFIAAMDDESHELKVPSWGPVDFIYTPFNRVVLLSKVSSMLSLCTNDQDGEYVLKDVETDKPKILVVDDTPENILVLEKLLAKLDAEVIATTSGNEALAKTLYNDFAVIFLDVQMPEMDGYEVAELLKSDEKTANIPIIFITAIDRDDAKEIKGYDKGAVDFIFKPFNKFILISKAKIFLDIYRMRVGMQSLIEERTAALRKSNDQLTREIENKEKAEGELLKARAYLGSIINSISAVLIGATIDGIVVDMNMAAVNLSGVQRETAIGRDVAEIVPDFASLLEEMIAKSWSSREGIERLNVSLKKDDIEKCYNLAVSPLIGEDAGQLVIRIDDVTEARQMERELQQRRHIDSLGQLAGGIAHDFNNMLGAIMGAADLLRLKLSSNQDVMKPIDNILTSAHRAADLTAKLLSFARKEVRNDEKVDVHQLIKDTVIILKRSIDKRIGIIMETRAENGTVKGSDSELSSALLNLGINARDAMPNGGTLTISTENRTIMESDQGSTVDLPPGNYVEISFKDTGIGMSEEVRRRVFEPFFTTKEVGKGTGLGLSSVYGTIKAHQGIVTVESEDGKGSRFSILLPVSGIQTVVQEKALAEVFPEKLTGTVLLVDDEEIIRSVGSEILVELGAEVIMAENGRKAIELVKKHKDSISLVLLDMIMPELNGPDCFREIQKIAPDMKVIICSGYAPDEMVESLSNAGVVGFIQKPFRIDELKRTITPWLV